MSIALSLTPVQEKQSVELFAQGYSRAEVALHLIDTEASLNALVVEHGVDLVKSALLQKLRLCDPTSGRFSVSKHGDHYALHRESVRQSLLKSYDVQVTRSITSCVSLLGELSDLKEALRHNFENAVETLPIGSGEYLSTLGAILNVSKRQLEVEEQLAARLERLREAGSDGDE